MCFSPSLPDTPPLALPVGVRALPALPKEVGSLSRWAAISPKGEKSGGTCRKRVGHERL